jgi:hypothetical protein
MPEQRSLTVNVNARFTIDAGSWQEIVEEDHKPHRLVSPPHTSMYQQVLLHLEEATRNEKVPPKSRMHFGEVALATVAICIRWGSYFAALTSRDLPQWTASFDPEVSWIGDGEMARVLVNPTRALANGILNEHWRNESGIEDVHAGTIAPPRPLTQCRLTRAQEALLMQETAELFVPTMRALYHVGSLPSEETWPQQALPYAIAFKPPADWSLDEQIREIALPDAEPE